MSQFLDSEAEESEDEELDEIDKKKAKRIKAMESDDDDDEDDEDKIREELKDLIDDNPIEESDGSGDESDGSKKRKKSDDEFDDRLEEDDYDLIEENLGVKVERRKRFKRLRRLEDEESDDDGTGENPTEDREAIANTLFDMSDNEEERISERASSRAERVDNYNIEGDEEGEGYSDEDDDGFIVDDDGRPIKEKKKKRKHIYHDAALQEAQDIFGVDFDYDEFEKYDDEYEDDASDDDYIEDEEDGEKRHRPKPQKRRKATRKSIFEIYEPIELKRGHFTDLDNQIRNNDIPERMQLREVPVTPVPDGSDELDDEAEWIYKQAFCKPTITTQEYKGGVDPRLQSKKGPQTIGKIKKALDFMRNQNFEVPFLAYYRKEYVEPELDINALWRVYHFDAKWCQLKSRKTMLIELMEKMRNYQMEMLMVDTNAPMPDHIRIIKEEDIDKLRAVQTNEELKDIQGHFMLYYANDVPAMQENARKKSREMKIRARELREEKRKLAIEAGEEVPEDEEDNLNLDDDELSTETVKPASSSGPYTMCLKAGLSGFAKRFGLKPEHFAVNVRDNYQRHEVDQESVDPYKLANEYCNDLLKTPEEVLKAGKYMVACQLSREPLIRKCLRETFFDRAKINIVPTKRGIKEIDENHNCYSMKYVRRKPVRDLVRDDFLKLQIAEDDKLLTVSFDEEVDGLGSLPYIEEVKQLYIRDEFSSNVQQWNEVRRECVDLAYRKLLMPEMVKELKRNLLAESKEHILKCCKNKLANWLAVGPYKPEIDEDDDDWDTSKGIRVMGLAYSPDHEQASFACILSTDGEVLDHLRLPYIMKRPFNDDVKAKRDGDFNHIKNFVMSKRPHVIVLGAESRDALWLVRDIKAVIDQLVVDEQFPQIQVEILDNHLARIYANSIKGENDFRDYPQLLREAISLGRRIQDPLVEFSQLCSTDEEILCLRYHQYQELLNQEELLEGLNQEFINRTNEVGVDINDVVQRVYAPNLLQFVCGLGPRKATALIKLMKQTNQRLENRTQLVTSCHMGPKIFINCAGFIKIDTNSLGDSTEAYVEVLDGSRVHPETYEWARKMAVDALEYDDEEANPAGALEEILDAPERLKDLDLDAFAEELERQGFGNKSITLYDIRQELNHRYKDIRVSFKPPNPAQVFELLTKETQETFFVGKMVLATVTGIARRKPQNDQLDKANPVRNDETGLWQCPFCFKNDFLELSDVWNHFDAGGCPGQASGIRIRLDNGINGFIAMKNLSNTHVANPEDRVRFNQAIHCRIIKIEPDRFSFEATSKSSDLKDEEHQWRPQKDPYYDHETETRQRKTELDKNKMKNAQTYIKRVIVHPCFHNVSFAEAVKLLNNSDQGDAIIRPSSKGADHLTVTWKVADNVYQHIDVQEKGKVNAFSLGRSLWIGTEEFEDLDEIIARHITPMAGNARELLRFRYYRDTDGGSIEKAEQILREEKANNPSKIHYIVSVSQKYAGKFLLSCLPTRRSKHEYITVTPDGYRFRSQNFDSIVSLFRWYKEHFRDATPHVTPATSRSVGQSYGPSPNLEPSPMNRSHSSHSNATPQYSQSPHASYSNMQPSAYNTPYTPSGQTPYMGNYTTPRYGTTQAPPVHDGVFLHPSSLTPIVQSSPRPSAPRPPVQSADPSDWRRMAEEWAKAKQRGDGYSTPMSDGGRHTPRSRYNNHRDRYNMNRERGVSTPRSDAPSPTPSASSFGYHSPAPHKNYKSGYTSSPHHSTKSPRGPPSISSTPYDPFTMDPGQESPGVYASSSRAGRNDENASDLRYASPGQRWTPRSGRSTPHTINSPRSMIESSMGDNTPMYDDS